MMNQLPFYWIDVFTSQKLQGNPCAVVLHADNLSDEKMQQIAKEINLSETAFVFKSKVADFKARYFTPEEELPFAGHPTIAVVKSLMVAGLISTNKKEISLELAAGVIHIEMVKNQIIMTQLAPKFLKTYKAEEILPIFGLMADDLLPNAIIQTVSTGTPILMTPLKNHESLKKARIVDWKKYNDLKKQSDFSFPHHFCLQGITAKGLTFARSLGTSPDIKEDPFTGSATGCMAAYLWHYGLIAKPNFIAQQGHWMGRAGEAEVEVLGGPSEILGVRLGGESQLLISGTIDL